MGRGSSSASVFALQEAEDVARLDSLVRERHGLVDYLCCPALFFGLSAGLDRPLTGRWLDRGVLALSGAAQLRLSDRDGDQGADEALTGGGR